jgi:hypothetical protein
MLCLTGTSILVLRDGAALRKALVCNCFLSLLRIGVGQSERGLMIRRKSTKMTVDHPGRYILLAFASLMTKFVLTCAFQSKVVVRQKERDAERRDGAIVAIRAIHALDPLLHT